MPPPGGSAALYTPSQTPALRLQEPCLDQTELLLPGTLLSLPTQGPSQVPCLLSHRSCVPFSSGPWLGGPPYVHDGRSLVPAWHKHNANLLVTMSYMHKDKKWNGGRLLCSSKGHHVLVAQTFQSPRDSIQCTTVGLFKLPTICKSRMRALSNILELKYLCGFETCTV